MTTVRFSLFPGTTGSAVLFVVAAISISAVTAEVEPPRSPQEVLEAAFAVPSSADYSGKRILWWQGPGDRRVEVPGNIWVSSEGKEKEVYEKPDGSPRYTVIRADGRLLYRADGQAAWHETSVQADPRNRLDHIGLIGRNYGLSRSDIYYLERRCIAVNAKPHREGRPELKVIVDAEKGVALLLEVSRPGSREGFGFRFERITYGPLDKGVFDLPSDATLETPGGDVKVDEYPSLREASSKAGFEVAVPERIPAGFTEVGCGLGPHPWLDKDGKGVTVRFSDGLGVISLYERPGDGRSIAGDPKRRFTEVKRDDKSVFCAQMGRNFILITDTNGIEATILGDVPLEELLDMAFSLAPAQ